MPADASVIRQVLDHLGERRIERVLKQNCAPRMMKSPSRTISPRSSRFAPRRAAAAERGEPLQSAQLRQGLPREITVVGVNVVDAAAVRPF
jgi:hypothetical protein